jgi:hypothetical protein
VAERKARAHVESSGLGGVEKGKHTPGAKARFFGRDMRLKAEALGYLEAKEEADSQRE